MDRPSYTVIRATELQYLTGLVYLAAAWGHEIHHWPQIGEGHVRVGILSDYHAIEARFLLRKHHAQRQARLATLPNPAGIPGFGGF